MSLLCCIYQGFCDRYISRMHGISLNFFILLDLHINRCQLRLDAFFPAGTVANANAQELEHGISTACIFC